MALNLHSFYSALERIFELIAQELDGGVLGGDAWHTEMLREWHDYARRGRMARNMQPQHAAAASGRGSWGVGRDYFRVRVESGQVFDIYYDRAPKGSEARKGAWFLYREVSAGDAAGG